MPISVQAHLTAADRELFPHLYDYPGFSIYGSMYRVSALKALEEIEKEQDERIGATMLKDLDHVRRRLDESWQGVDKDLSNAVLDGTVDGFPELWVGNGAGYTLEHGGKGDSAKEVRDRMDLAIDYFAGARRCLTEAAVSMDSKDPWKGGVTRLYDTMLGLNAATHVKVQRYRPNLGRILLALLCVALVVFLGYDRQVVLDLGSNMSASPSVVMGGIYAVGAAAALLALFLAYKEIRYFIISGILMKGPRRVLEQDALGPERRRADAYRLLRYYQLWREDVRTQRGSGYYILDTEGSDVVPDCLKRMDEVIKRMEESITAYDRVYGK